MTPDFLSNLFVTKVICTNRINLEENPNPKLKKGTRKYWGISIKLSGKTEYICNGEKIVCDSHNAVILPKGVEHTWKDYGGQGLFIDFDAEQTYGYISSINVKDASKLTNMFYKIENNRIENDTYSEIKNFKYMYEILVYLAEKNNKKYIPAKKAEVVRPAVEYILTNYNNPDISVEMLSKISKCSEANFRKIFYDVYNYPPMSYVNRVRMNKASDLLKGDYTSVEDISQFVGYNSVYHFSKMFKKHFGVSPSVYSKMFKQIDEPWE